MTKIFLIRDNNLLKIKIYFAQWKNTQLLSKPNYMKKSDAAVIFWAQFSYISNKNVNKTYKYRYKVCQVINLFCSF